MTKILYFSSLFPTHVWPHLGMFSVQRIRALQNAGCEVIVVCPVLITLPARLMRNPVKLYQWVKNQIRLPQEDHVQGIHAYYPKWVWFPKGLFGWYTGYFLYKQIQKRMARLIGVFQPDVILSSWLPDGVAASKLGVMVGLPTIAIADGSDVNFLSRSYPGWRYACSLLNEKNSTVVFVSNALKEKGKSLGLYGGNSSVIYNAVDLQLFQPDGQKPEDDVFTVLSIGRLVPVKGHHVLLAGFAKLYECLYQKARLIIVGEGPLENDLRQQASELNILSGVDFVGAVKHEEIAAYFHRADVFCLPSFSEGSPAVIFEAMACGRPVIASDVGGVGEIITNDLGILVPPGDPERLFQALLQAKDRAWNPIVIRKEMEDHYEWSKWTKKVLDLIPSFDHSRMDVQA